MSEPSMYEKGRAASEARDTVAARPASSSATAITAAMRRYLAAEQYRELSGEDEPPREKPWRHPIDSGRPTRRLHGGPRGDRARRSGDRGSH